jgi:hypothetical protein
VILPRCDILDSVPTLIRRKIASESADLIQGIEEKLIQALTGERIKQVIGHVSSIFAKTLNESLKETLSHVLRVPGPSTMRTYSLPYLGDPDALAIRVATAGDAPYEVIVRTVHPPGSFAVFCFDATELNGINPPPFGPGITLPPFGGDVLVLPGGQFQLIRLRPKQSLYAKGNIGFGFAGASAVVASLTTGDFAASMSTAVPFMSAG